MSDEQGGSQQELATKEEVRKLTEEIGQIKELLRSLTVTVLRAADSPAGNMSKEAEVGTDMEQEEPHADFLHGIGAGFRPAPVKVSPPSFITRPLGKARPKRARVGSLEDETEAHFVKPHGFRPDFVVCAIELEDFHCVRF